MEAFGKPAKTLLGDKSLDQDSKQVKEGSKGASAAAAFTAEKLLENSVRVSVNGEGLEDSEMNGVSSLLQMSGSFRNIDVINGVSECVKGFGTLLGAVDRSEEEIGAENLIANGGDDDDGGGDFHGEISEIDSKGKRDFHDDKENGGEMVNERHDDGGGGVDDGDDDLDCEFSVGDFVWGKIKSHPWWPGQVYNSSAASDYAVKIRQKGRLLVAYFGDSSFAWCHPSQLKPFEENFEDMSKMSNSRNFVNAVQTSVDEIGRLVKLKMTCSCVPKENRSGLDRHLAENAGIKKGILVPEDGIAKLSAGQSEPEEILGKLKQIAQGTFYMSNLLECSVLKGWVSAFNSSIRHGEMSIYQEPLSIPDLEDDPRTLVVDMSDYTEAVESPIMGTVKEDQVSSSSGSPKFGHCSQNSLKCPEISEDGMYQGRKQKSIAEIIKGELDAKYRKDLVEKGTKSSKKASSSRRKKTKGNDKANGDDDDDGSNSSSVPRKRKGTELSGSITARKGKRTSVETDDIVAKEEIDKTYSLRGRKGKKTKGASDNVDDDDGGGGGGKKEETDKHPVSARRKVNVGSGIGNSDAETNVERGSLLRERKKSKYLSPPYTNATMMLGKMDAAEAESLKVSRVGKQTVKATGDIVGSPVALSHNGKRNQVPGEDHAEHKASNDSTPKQHLNEAIDTEKVDTLSSDVLTDTRSSDVLAEVRSVALSPQNQRKNNSFENVVKFLSVFRNSVYRNGSDYKMYKQSQSNRKRKAPDSATGSSGKDQIPTDGDPSGHRSQQKKVGKNKEIKMDQSKPKQATRKSPKKTSEESNANNPKIKQSPGDMEVVGGNASPLLLFLTFGPGSSLPTKDDLIRIYSRYGALDTEETDMFFNNFCARVVFLRSSDAEKAFNSSQNSSPFGSSDVSFRLRPPTSVAAKHLRETPNSKPSPPPAKQGAKRRSKQPLSASRSSAADHHSSQLNHIRDKLEMLTSMLETSDEKMSSEVKSKLQSEIKELVKVVYTMIESSS